MKNKILLFVCIAASLLSSCNNVFDDLAINPSQPSMTAYFTTPQAVDEAVMTLYGYIQTSRAFGASASKTMIIRSDEASSNSDYGKPGMYGADLNSSYYTIMQPFGLMYTTASQVCFVLENIDKVPFSDQQQKQAYIGESYFWRAFAHYYLLISYRNVAPIYRMPKDASDYVRPVAKYSDVWDYICSDLKSAIENLPAKGYWKGSDLGRVTKASAAALLGKAYLYRSGIEPKYGEDTRTFYTEAAEAFNEIIKGTYGTYSLVTYGDNFDVAHENNDESVFEMQFKGDVINNAFNPGQANSALNFDGRGIMLPGTGAGYEGVVHQWLYDAFTASIDKDGYTDIRMFSTMLFNDKKTEIKLRPGQRVKGPGGYNFEDYYPNGNFTGATVGNARCAPYKAAILKGLELSMPMRNSDPKNIVGVGAGTQEYIYNQPRAHGVNWRYIRYADVLLMYAEAVVMGGTQGVKTSASAYNDVRDRANMPQKASITLADIKSERVLEFALEGHRYFDLLRWGELPARFDALSAADPYFKKFISDTDYKGFVPNKNEWLPIPVDEIESNPYARQNSPLY